MNIKDLEKVKKPIIYIALALIISSISYGVNNNYGWLAVSSASLFFICVFLNTNITFTILVGAFFTIGILFNINYYNVDIAKDFKGIVRITEVKSYYQIGEYKGRKLYIEGNNVKAKMGEKYLVSGSFYKEPNYEKGVVGKIKVKNKSEVLKKDIIELLYEVRQDIYYSLKDNLGKRKASLVTSVAFGYSEYIDSEDKDDMRSLGIIHAISVSGLHIVLIFSILSKLTNKGIGFLITIVYVIFTGAAFSSIRALIMIGSMILSISVRKNYNSLGGLALSAIIITLLKPYAPMQLGFILSFLATLGIILFSYPINNRFYKLPKYLRETLAVSISAQIFVLPVLMVAFKELSLTFILGNVLVIPIINGLIIVGNISIIVCYIPFLFDFISYILLKIINLIDCIIDLLFTIGNSTVIVNEGATLVYVLSIIAMYYIAKGYKKFRWLPIIGVIVAIIQIYSPILRINYLREGGILVSYKGDRKIITNKLEIDIEKLKKQNLADKAIRQGKKINIENGIKIVASGKNFIMFLGNTKYLLKLNSREEIDERYDIINFVDGHSQGLYVLDDKIILY